MIVGRARPRLALALVAAAVGLVVGLGPGCRAQNLDHCVHKAADPDAWCQANTPTSPYCSPCAADNHGCVAAPPTECPEYQPGSATDEVTSSSGDPSSTT